MKIIRFCLPLLLLCSLFTSIRAQTFPRMVAPQVYLDGVRCQKAPGMGSYEVIQSQLALPEQNGIVPAPERRKSGAGSDFQSATRDQYLAGFGRNAIFLFKIKSDFYDPVCYCLCDRRFHTEKQVR